jgi:hypothetical protein
MLMNLLGIPAVQQTAERIAYDEPLTTGRGMTTQIRPEVIEAAMTVAPAVGLLGRGVERGAMAAGRAGERYAEKVVPQIMERGGLPAQLLGDLSQGTVSPLDVYHGTPYKFDRFDSSKIGTGEGAQVYGHGLYVAENPMVAKQYADNVKDMSSITNMNAELSRLLKVMDSDSAGGYRKFKSNVGEEAAQQYDDLINKRNSVSTAEGNLYKADLPDEKIALMLDWDKRLSEQTTQVQNALKNSNIAEIWKAQYGVDIEKNKPQLDMVYKAVSDQLGGPAAASKYFKEIGINLFLSA